ALVCGIGGGCQRSGVLACGRAHRRCRALRAHTPRFRFRQEQAILVCEGDRGALLPGTPSKGTGPLNEVLEDHFHSDAVTEPCGMVEGPSRATEHGMYAGEPPTIANR